ncbi:MAG: hypothetical protein OEV28_00195 [Nitrospirota bacterium]|nr:hypothetical protein [Nitrospirota bacterium]
MRGKQLLFSALLVMLLGLAAYRFYSPDMPAGVLRAPAEGRRAAADLKDYTVRIDLLRVAREELADGVVNIFASISRSGGSKGEKAGAKGADEVKPPAPSEQPAVQLPPPPPPKTPEQLAAERSVQELERFRFLGFVRKGDGRSLFLGRGDELLVVGETEKVKGLYNIKLMGKDYLILADPATGVEKRIELTGK